MQISAFGLTDIGRVRDENQDAFFIDEKHQAYAVADGLGGLPGGADASRRIVELLQNKIGQIKVDGEQLDLAELIINISQIVAKESAENYPVTGSASTLTLCKIVTDQLFIAHVGDSAAYLLRNGELEKLTIDHTLEQELVDLHGEEARKHMPPEYPHTLTRCIGQEGEVRVDQTRVGLEKGDRILLCTDGLNKVVSEKVIADVLGDDLSPEEISKKLIEEANANSGPDNITIVTLMIA